jgi:general secretion pathway protein N
MKTVLRLVAALVLLAALLLGQAPATWLDSLLQGVSRGHVGLAEARGSIWQGRGVIQALLPTGRVESLASVRWRTDPGALLSARLRLVMHNERDGKPVLDASLSTRGIDIDRLDIEAPAGLLGLLSPSVRAAQASGRLLLQTRGMHLAGGSFRGDANLLWRDADSSLTPVHPLGSYAIDFRGAGRGLDFQVSTRGNAALALSGSGQWQPDAPLALNAYAVPAPDRAAQLAPLLRILGKESGDGRYLLHLDGSAGLAGG